MEETTLVRIATALEKIAFSLEKITGYTAEGTNPIQELNKNLDGIGQMLYEIKNTMK